MAATTAVMLCADCRHPCFHDLRGVLTNASHCAETPTRMIGMELTGHGVTNVVNGLVSSLGTAAAMVLTAEDDRAGEAIRYFFVETAEHSGHRLR